MDGSSDSRNIVIPTNYLGDTFLYILILSVIFVILVVISILITSGGGNNKPWSNPSVDLNPYVYTYKEGNISETSTITLLNSLAYNRVMVPLQGYFAGSVIFNEDLARTACHIRGKDASQ